MTPKNCPLTTTCVQSCVSHSTLRLPCLPLLYTIKNFFKKKERLQPLWSYIKYLLILIVRHFLQYFLLNSLVFPTCFKQCLQHILNWHLHLMFSQTFCLAALESLCSLSQYQHYSFTAHFNSVVSLLPSMTLLLNIVLYSFLALSRILTISDTFSVQYYTC